MNFPFILVPLIFFKVNVLFFVFFAVKILRFKVSNSNNRFVFQCSELYPKFLTTGLA